MRKARFQNDFVAGLEVADVGGVQAIAMRFQHYRGVAFFQRFLILALRFTLGDDHAILAFGIEFGREAEQHRHRWQRKGVDNFEDLFAGVAVGLA